MKIVFRTLVIAIALCLLLTPATALAQSQPPIVPLLYHGSVTIDGEDAPIGTIITAEIGDQEIATNAPGGTTAIGIYELPVAADQGDLVVLKVNGYSAVKRRIRPRQHISFSIWMRKAGRLPASAQVTTSAATGVNVQPQH